MNNEINIIKSYATDSLEYGKRSGNIKATKRGTEVLFALDKITEDIKKVRHLNDLIVTNQRTLSKLEDNFIDRIDPSKHKTATEWRMACDKLLADINGI